MTIAVADSPGFGVYVHWPYCAAICPYCDFNVYRDRGADHDALLAALAADIRGWRDRTGPRTAGSVFFGGGTPSLLSPDAMARILEAVDDAWGLAPDAEISLEANPEDVDAARCAAWRGAGVTRVSLGVQSFDDAALNALGRAHDGARARAAAAFATEAFPHVSVDLIYARAAQTVDAWAAELSVAFALGLSHLSLYQLTIEPGTAFARRAARGDDPSATTPNAAALYEATQDLCAAAGLSAYEVSNHARDDTARSRHNLLYWRSGEWAGVGPGAHGRIGALGLARRATEAARRPEDYVAAVRTGGWGVVADDPLALPAQRDEMILMGLRLSDGLDRARLREHLGVDFDGDALAALEADGLLRISPERLTATSRGRLVTDQLALTLTEAMRPT